MAADLSTPLSAHPLEQEMIMDFVGLPMVNQSFTGVHLYTPIPGRSSKSLDRDAYKAYQQYLHMRLPAGEAGSTSGLSFLEWWRRYQIKKKTGDAETQEATFEVKERNPRRRSTKPWVSRSWFASS